MNSRSQTILDYAIVTMIAGMILSTVSSQKIPSLLFYILIAASCFNWYVHYKKGTSTEGIELKQHKTLFILCSVSLVAVLVSKAVHLNMSGTEIEKAVRFSIGLPLLYAGIRFVPYERLKHALWGVYAAILFQFVYVLFLVDNISGRPNTSEIHNAVSYGVLALLFICLTILSFGVRLINNPNWEKILKTTIMILGIITLILLRTRTGLVVIPVFVLIVTIVYFNQSSSKKIIIIYILSVLIILAGLMSSPAMQSRTKFAFRQLYACMESNVTIDSSVCTRLQLINASIEIWKEFPLFGTGDNSKFQEIMNKELLEKGIVTKATAQNFGEPHNDYVQNLSSFGVFGLLGFILLYLAPTVYFVKGFTKKNNLKQRCLAGMGVATCLGFTISSLTELMFRNMRTTSFFTTLVSLFLILFVLLLKENKQGFISERESEAALS